MRVIPTRDAPDPGEAAVGFGIATAARDVAISVGVVLGLLYLFPILGRVFGSPSWHRGPQHTGLMTTGLRLQAGTGLSGLPISALAGPGLLVGLAACALVVAGLLLRLGGVEVDLTRDQFGQE
jgi:ABC-2 type transport system permease protein